MTGLTKHVFAFACLALVLLAVAPPGARTSAAAKQYRYRVVVATHSSSSKKSDLPFYAGTSTSAWHLTPATRRAPNVVALTLGPITQGLGTVNVSGVYTLDATDQKYGRCQLTAPTWSKSYPAVAPGPFTLAIGQDPSAPSRATVAMGLGSAVYATLGASSYVNCATSLTGEPSVDTTSLMSIPKSALGRPTVTVQFAGHTNSGGIDYTWSTTIKLKRIKPHR
jgi:hypothetical protein